MTKIRDENLLKEFGKHLREVRLSKKVTQEDLAFKAGIAFSSVARMEGGHLNTTISTIAKLAEALGVQKKELLDF